MEVEVQSLNYEHWIGQKTFNSLRWNLIIRFFVSKTVILKLSTKAKIGHCSIDPMKREKDSIWNEWKYILLLNYQTNACSKLQVKKKKIVSAISCHCSLSIPPENIRKL